MDKPAGSDRLTLEEGMKSEKGKREREASTTAV
jgi:hypothetical protein